MKWCIGRRFVNLGAKTCPLSAGPRTPLWSRETDGAEQIRLVRAYMVSSRPDKSCTPSLSRPRCIALEELQYRRTEKWVSIWCCQVGVRNGQGSAMYRERV